MRYHTQAIRIACFTALAGAIVVVLAPNRLAAQNKNPSSAAHQSIASSRERTRVAILPIHNGRNSFDLLGNGQSGEIIVSRRPNGNAHGYSIVLFQVLAPADGGSQPAWQVIPFFGGPHDANTGEDLFGTVEGADCTLRDLRIIRRGRAKPIEVVTALRDFGTSFADSASVRFDFYELRANTEWLGPTYLFHHTRFVRTKGTYCDVDDAFDRELGLGTAGVLRWDGPR
jgi:hypothetical protein